MNIATISKKHPSSRNSLKEVIGRIASTNDLYNVYIGAHGSETYIRGPGDERITRSILRNMLQDIPRKDLHGLFLGCCLFGRQVKYLASETNLTWIAGYTEDVDWVHASAMDLYFWNAYYQSSVPKRGGKRNLADSMALLLGVLYSRVPYLFSELGFQVAISKQAGSSKTFPIHWSEEDLGHLKVETDIFVRENPGKWP